MTAPRAEAWRHVHPLRPQRLLSILHEDDRALDELNAIISKFPANSAAYSLRGFTRMRKGQTDPALADFNEAIRLDATDGYSRCQRGELYYIKAEYAKAIADFDEVIRRAPESPASVGAYRQRAAIRSGCEDAQFRDGRLALESATKACELTAWKDAECLIVLANAQNLVGDEDSAIATIDKAIALLEPGDKRIETCQSMRDTFEVNLLNKLGVKKSFER